MQSRKDSRKIISIIALAIIIIVVGIVYLVFNTDPDPVIALNDGYDIYRASLADAKDGFDSGEALFIDVRSQESYDVSHITGSIVIPLNDLPGNEPSVNKDALIYTYCT